MSPRLPFALLKALSASLSRAQEGNLNAGFLREGGESAGTDVQTLQKKQIAQFIPLKCELLQSVARYILSELKRSKA